MYLLVMSLSCSLRPGITIFGLYGTLTVGQSAIIKCMINIAVSSIEWKNETSTLASISAANLTVLEYTIDPVKDDLQGQELTCVAVAGDSEYTETEVVDLRGMSGMRYCCIG